MRAALILALFAVPVQAAFLKNIQSDKACLSEDVQHRVQLQNKLAGFCVDMCKEVGAFPKCNCPDFVAPDATPGVMTWPELLEHMDNLVEWGQETIKGWKKTASALQKSAGSRGAQGE